MGTTYALERGLVVILEARTEPYISYGEGEQKRKLSKRAKNNNKATGCASWQIGVVRKS